MLVISVIGLIACIISLSLITADQLDTRFLFLALVTIFLASRITVPIPFAVGQVTASDTLIFLTIFLCGGEAAILLAALEGAYSALPYTKTRLTICFNAAVLAIATFASVWTLKLFFGSSTDFIESQVSVSFIAGIYGVALVQYFTNLGLVAVRTAFKTNQPIWATWRQHFLWISIAYVASVSAAAITAKLVASVGFLAVVLTFPIIAIVFTTYQSYRKKLEMAAEKTVQAERHIEELNKYIEEQIRLREQVAHAEKLSALGEMASGVAHNFNNVLAVILGRAQLVLRNKTIADEIRRSLEIIATTAGDGASTVRRIQDFARQRQHQDFRLVAVDQLLLDIGEVTRPRWKDHAEASNIHITLAVEIDSKALVMGDAGELREVLINMVFNAVDAMPDGGRLHLATKEVGEAVEISVSDTGTGMTDEVRSRIFDPFYTTKGTAGMGLGLAVSYGIVVRHGGKVEVDTKLGSGTTFRIILPLAPAHEVQPVPQNSVAIDYQAQIGISDATLINAKTKILVVEDEDHISDVMREVLEAEGCEVVVAKTGAEAINFYDTERFDAVFTDVGLPGVNGWEVARHIRDHDERILIAVVTGWGDTVSADKQTAAKVDRVIPKPFDIKSIVDLAHEVIEKRELHTRHVVKSLADTNNQSSNMVN